MFPLVPNRLVLCSTCTDTSLTYIKHNVSFLCHYMWQLNTINHIIFEKSHWTKSISDVALRTYYRACECWHRHNTCHLMHVILWSMLSVLLIGSFDIMLTGSTTINQSHKSHSALVPYPTMHHLMVHCGIWDKCIVGVDNLVYSTSTTVVIIYYDIWSNEYITSSIVWYYV